MPKRNRLAAIVNQLTAQDLASVSADQALAMMCTLRRQPSNPETDAALKRLATHVLREDGVDIGESSPEARLIH